MMARMSRAELALFTAFLRRSRRYVEFGTGGSTCTASNCVAELIISVDSSREWLNKVYAHCDGIKPRLVHIDIGETIQWGFPKDDSTRESWPRYHSAVWDDPDSKTADLYLIDGRFRVACLAGVAAQSTAGSNHNARLYNTPTVSCGVAVRRRDRPGRGYFCFSPARRRRS
jgi:hypothetical protein